jgi:sugar lactone lactonase YvrE
MADTQTLIDGLDFGEGPRWRDGVLWFSDFYRRAVFTVDADGHEERVVEVPQQPSGLGWLPDGRMLVVSMVDQRVMRLEEDGSLVEHADVSDVATHHANDMLVDGHGRAYVGNFGYDLHEDLARRPPDEIIADEEAGAAHLARVDPDGTVTAEPERLRFPNGMVLLDGGRTLVVAETLGLRLTAFTVTGDGSLADRRVWASTAEGPHGPVATDGIATDPQGGIWVANGLGQECVRFAEGGEVTAAVETSTMCYACALGGEEGRTLFCMVAPSSDPREVDGKGLGAIEIATV